MEESIAGGEWRELQSNCESPRPPILVNRRERRFLHVGCNRWRCKGCARRKSKRVQKRMLLMEPTHLLTFSLRRSACAVEDDLRELHGRRRAFYRWLQRQPWGMVRQGWIVEVGELNGQLHIHALVRMRSRFLPYSKVQEAARRVGLGVPDFQQIWRQETAARYVAKYVSKGLGEVGLRRTTRRFGMSTGFTLAKNPDWTLSGPEDDLPIPASVLRLVLSAPMFAVPSG